MATVQDLPVSVLEKIFNHLVHRESSYWPCVSRLGAVNHDWSTIAEWSKLRSCLVLDENVILRIKRSHDENDPFIINNIIKSGSLKYLTKLEFRHFQRYMNKILALLDENIEAVNLKHLIMSNSHGGYLDDKWSNFLTRFCQELETFEANKFAPFKQGCLKQVLALPNLSCVRLINIGPLSGKIDWSVAKNLVELEVTDFDPDRYETYYEMSEMEQAMNSVWLPSGRKFHLPKLKRLILRNVHFVKSPNSEPRFYLDELEEVTLGPYIFRDNQNFQTNITLMISTLLQRRLRRINLLFDQRDNWLQQRNFLDEIKSGLCSHLTLGTEQNKINRENLVFLMLFMGNEVIYDSIDFGQLEIVEDNKIVMKMENSRYERDSEELEEFLHKLHSI